MARLAMVLTDRCSRLNTQRMVATEASAKLCPMQCAAVGSHG